MTTLRSSIRRWFDRHPQHARRAIDQDPSESIKRLSVGLLDEAEAMADYAFSSGKEVPPTLMTALQRVMADPPSAERGIEAVPGSTLVLSELSRIHQSLARIVHPATPRSILLLAREGRRPLAVRILGPVPLVRGLTIAALISVAAWIGLSTTQAADGTVNWTEDHGVWLLIEELHLLAAAGVGAAFAGLFQASRYVTRGTYDPKYASSYWTRFVLGVVAGMILALLIPLESDALGSMGAPLLAMLGGFSVRVVYRLLRRLVLTVESMVGGEPGVAEAQEVEVERARLQEQRRQEQINLGSQLVTIVETLQHTKSDPAIIRHLHELTLEVLGGNDYTAITPADMSRTQSGSRKRDPDRRQPSLEDQGGENG